METLTCPDCGFESTRADFTGLIDPLVMCPMCGGLDVVSVKTDE